MRSSICYHGQAAMVCLLDAEWSMRRSSDYCEPYCRLQNEIRVSCARYRAGIEDAWRSFQKAKDPNQEAPDPLTADSSGLASHFYKPLVYLPFGHADAIAVVLLDDFDALQHLTASFKATVESIDLGFCPKLESLGPAPDRAFRDLSKLLDRAPESVPLPESQCRFEQQPDQDKFPLLVYTKYKFDWLGTTGYGLLFEQSLLKAVAKRVKDVRDQLEGSLSDPVTVRAIDKPDLDFAVVTLDLQSEEEFATITLCRNYSVAMSVVAGLRGLTLGDLFDADEGQVLRRALDNSSAHKRVLQLYSRLRNVATPGSWNEVRGNHVFRWTNSLLAASPRVVFDPSFTDYGGYVEASALFQIAPGHRALVEKRLQCNHGKSAAVPDLSNFHRFEIGAADLVVPFSQAESWRPVVPIGEAISLVRENLKVFGSLDDEQNGSDPGRHVVDMTTAFSVPVPSGAMTSGQVANGTHKPIISTVVPFLSTAVFYPEKLPPPNKLPVKLKPDYAQLKLASLDDDLGRCGIPVELRRTILHLYHDLANYISDPFLFDGVLDLCDVFSTFYVTLTSHLPRCRAQELGLDLGTWLDPLDGERVESISAMVGALHNAVTHRISSVFPESPVRDTAIDFRGGLTQVVLAANAPMICALGLLRKYGLGVGPNEPARNTVGGLASISLTPGTRARWLNLAGETPVLLALVEADVPHILHPPAYADYLHECAHLILRSLGAQHMLSLTLASIEGGVMAERIHEIFANLLTFLVLFAGDRDTFLCNQILSFSKSQASLTGDPQEAMAAFSELIIRLFIVVDCVAPGTPRRTWLEQPWRRQKSTVEKVAAEFEQVLDRISRFLPDSASLWRGEKSRGRMFCLEQFKWIYPKVALHMKDVWYCAISVFREYYHRDLLECLPAAQDTHEEPIDPQLQIACMVRSALAEGRPLVRCLWRQSEKGNTDADGFDPLGLCSAMLYQYLARIKDVIECGVEVHLHRDRATGKPLYDSGIQWYDFQVDPGATAMFSPVPDARCGRLKREIVILKTLWDIAANLRARRLDEIIKNVVELGA